MNPSEKGEPHSGWGWILKSTVFVCVFYVRFHFDMPNTTANLCCVILRQRASQYILNILRHHPRPSTSSFRRFIHRDARIDAHAQCTKHHGHGIFDKDVHSRTQTKKQHATPFPNAHKSGETMTNTPPSPRDDDDNPMKILCIQIVYRVYVLCIDDVMCRPRKQLAAGMMGRPYIERSREIVSV